MTHVTTIRALGVMTVLGGCLLVPQTITAGEKVSLGPRFKTGDRCYIQLEQDIHQEMIQNGNSTVTDAKTLRGVLQKVAAATSAGVELELVFDRAMQSIDSAMIKTSYDSDNGDSPTASPMFRQLLKPMLGQPLLVKLDEKMHPISLKGMTDISKKIADEAEKDSNFFWNQMRQEYTDERALFTWGDSLFQLYPDHPVEAGETWIRDLEDDYRQLGRVHYHYECKLDRTATEDGKKSARVLFKGVFKSVPTSQPATNVTSANSIDGLFEGTAIFDLERGLMTQRDEERKTTVQATTPARRKLPPQPIELRITVDQRIKMLTTKERAREKQAAESRRADERRKLEAAAATQPSGASKNVTKQTSRKK